MKKLIYFSFLFFLVPLMVNASFHSVSMESFENGKVEMEIRTNEGFVRALEFDFVIDGVQVSDIILNPSLDATLRYEQKNGTIRVLVSGRKDHVNLVDENGQISLGTILVAGEESKMYQIKGTLLHLVKMDYQSVVVPDFQPTFQFSYLKSESGEIVTPTPDDPILPEEDPSNEPQEKPVESKPIDQNEDNKTENESVSTNGSGNSNSSSNQTGDQNGSNSKEPSKKNENKENESNLDEPTEDKISYSGMIVFIVMGIAIILFLFFLYHYVKRFKK